MKKRELFTTADVWLSAALSILLKIEPDFKVQNNKTFFLFPAEAKTYKAIADFNSGCQIDAFLYSEVVKRLRVEMLTRRQAGGEQQ